jgi:hypothetical protein
MPSMAPDVFDEDILIDAMEAHHAGRPYLPRGSETH